jgi:hypothetical protein
MSNNNAKYIDNINKINSYEHNKLQKEYYSKTENASNNFHLNYLGADLFNLSYVITDGLLLSKMIKGIVDSGSLLKLSIASLIISLARTIIDVIYNNKINEINTMSNYTSYYNTLILEYELNI